MGRSDACGQFEQLVLTAILTLDKGAYGITIHERVTELSHPKKVALGAVYVTLDRLEDKGLIKSYVTGPTPERGGRSKRCYEVLAVGQHALGESFAMTARLQRALSKAGPKHWRPA